MRKYLHIHLERQVCETEELAGEALVCRGRNLIARTLLADGVAKVDPLGPKNPLIFSAGPFAGSNFSNANRICVGCKSPLTCGIKEANSGGTFAFALGQIEAAGLTLHGVSDDWVVIRITRDGRISFDPAQPYLGLGTETTAKLLFERYGHKVSIALCGPVGEYMGLMAGISFTDTDGRPSRLAARGGVGAVMGSKKVKAIVIDLYKMPPFHDRKKLISEIREYGARIVKDPTADTFRRLGTAAMGDVMNLIGALPVNNFSSGQLVNPAKGTFKLGGDYVRTLNMSRGGEPTHACMPGCQIECSNVYVDAQGKEMVSPLEYESLGLMGSNLGLTHPDEVARLNAVANDLGVDSIETGAMLGVLLEDGQAAFGDLDFLLDALEDMRRGNERGRLLAQGAAQVGAHYRVRRIPTVKRQAISAYDPRVIEVTGISMMLTAQGADHTAGAAATYECDGKTTAELVAVSIAAQIAAAAADLLGLCIFGRTVTAASCERVINALNAACGTELPATYLQTLGRETILREWEFNKAAGFTEADNGLPDYFYTESLPPSGKMARHSSAEVSRCLQEQLAVQIF